jgi:hypothetical protein
MESYLQWSGSSVMVMLLMMRMMITITTIVIIFVVIISKEFGLNLLWFPVFAVILISLQKSVRVFLISCYAAGNMLYHVNLLPCRFMP